MLKVFGFIRLVIVRRFVMAMTDDMPFENFGDALRRFRVRFIDENLHWLVGQLAAAHPVGVNHDRSDPVFVQQRMQQVGLMGCNRGIDSAKSAQRYRQSCIEAGDTMSLHDVSARYGSPG